MMDLEKAGITTKGIAEALLASARVLNRLADELTVASNEP